jgi:hypothetical protein
MLKSDLRQNASVLFWSSEKELKENAHTSLFSVFDVALNSLLSVGYG